MFIMQAPFIRPFEEFQRYQRELNKKVLRLRHFRRDETIQRLIAKIFRTFHKT